MGARPTLAELDAGSRHMRDEWRDDAACRGRSDLMDPPHDQRTADVIRAAKRLCWSCPVRSECLAWALAQPESVDGCLVVGGLTEAERRTRRRSMRTKAAIR